MVQRITVIGSNSFSGAFFVQHCLGRGYEVLGISRSPEPDVAFLPYRWEEESKSASRFRFHQGDLNRDLDSIDAAIRDFGSPIVVNFASQGMVAESWEAPADWYTTNVVSNVLLHERLRRMPFLSKFVHISTPEVYGNCQDRIPESESYRPTTPYATSRAACDMSLMNFRENYGFPVVFTRAANVFGPGQQLYRIIPRTIMGIKTGRKLQLHGGGSSVRSFIHMADVSEATLRIANQAEPGEIYHLSTERFVSVRELVEMICDQMGVAFTDHVEVVGERPGKDHAYLLDSSKARKELQWKPVRELEDGIAETVRWVEDHFETLKQQPLHYIHKK